MQTTDYKQRVTSVVLWLSPTLLELGLYIFIGLFTLFISNLSIVREVLYATGDFNPIRSAVDSITQVLERIVGERVAGSLSLAIFWGLVGLIVNALWWVGSNFSTELNNDLVFSNYIHPRNYDPKSELREFITRSLFRFGIIVIFFFYINFFISEALPHLTTRYSTIISTWSSDMNVPGLLYGLVGQILLLHGFVVLTRLVLLKKQIFGGH